MHLQVRSLRGKNLLRTARMELPRRAGVMHWRLFWTARLTPSGRGSHLSTRQERLCVSLPPEAVCVHSQPILATPVEVVLPCHLRHHALLLESCNMDDVRCNVCLSAQLCCRAVRRRRRILRYFPADPGLIRCLVPHGRAS